MKEKMIKRIVGSAAALALVAGIVGCGEERAIPAQSTTISGTLQQGNIQGASVFLDLNGDGKLDASDIAAPAKTGTDGKYSLPLTASQVAQLVANISTAKIVGKGGVDTSTNLPQGLLAADPPAVTALTAATGTGTVTSNVTPLTTLVTFTPAASKDGLKALLKDLGLKDSSGNLQVDKLPETSTAAILTLVKSVETALTTLQSTVAAAGNETVALEVAKSTATEIGKALATTTVGALTNNTTGTQTLATTLATAAETAIKQVDTATANLTVTTAQLANIKAAVDTSCKGVADAIKTQSGGSLSTSGSVNEATVVAAVKDQIQTIVNTAATTITNNTTVVVDTTTDTTPPMVVLTGSKTGVVLNPVITAQFSEDVTGVTGTTFTLKSAAGATVSGTVSYSSTTFTATFTPAANLASATTYTATLSKSITDKKGNAMAADVTLTFTTTSLTGGTGATGSTGGTGISF